MTAAIVTNVGTARLTMGFDRFDRLDLDRHRAVHGRLPKLSLSELVALADTADLRGRGGAAFPFARKLRAVASAAGKARGELEDNGRSAPGDGPVIVVNVAEGEAGSLKDKVLLSRAPHLVLDGAVLAARALRASEIVIALVPGGEAERSIRAALAERELRARVVGLVERFISGESGAVIRRINGEEPIPPGRKVRASEQGVDGYPTLLSNTETWAQLAVLALLGSDLYAGVGTPREPGTVMMTVGGSTVVEVPTGTPLRNVLQQCDQDAGQGVLMGGYHGAWLSAAAAETALVSRAGFTAVGATLGAGIVLPLTHGTCPLGETIRIATYMAGQSAGQCGPCRLGLPDVVRALNELRDGAGGPDGVRRACAIGRGRGACSHPDGTARFVLSALEAFPADINAHMSAGGCGQPTFGVLPLPIGEGGDSKITIDWSRCDGHGLCAYLVPELIRLDKHGFPIVLDSEVPTWLEPEAQRAVNMCPALAMRLVGINSAPIGRRK